MPGRLVSAIRKTSVSAPWAMPAQSSRDSGLVGSSWPVITAKLEAYRRSVTGMPAYAGAATDELTPGTTMNGTPRSRRCVASSPPRPKTNGSPPLSRTTHLPCSACSASSSLMRGWGTACTAACLPT